MSPLPTAHCTGGSVRLHARCATPEEAEVANAAKARQLYVAHSSLLPLRPRSQSTLAAAPQQRGSNSPTRRALSPVTAKELTRMRSAFYKSAPNGQVTRVQFRTVRRRPACRCVAAASAAVPDVVRRVSRPASVLCGFDDRSWRTSGGETCPTSACSRCLTLTSPVPSTSRSSSSDSARCDVTETTVRTRSS